MTGRLIANEQANATAIAPRRESIIANIANETIIGIMRFAIRTAISDRKDGTDCNAGRNGVQWGADRI